MQLMSSTTATARLQAEKMISGREFVTRQIADILIQADLVDDLDFTSTSPWVRPEHRYSH